MSGIPPEEVTRALLDAIHEFRAAVVGPPAPDNEIQTWPICTPEGDFAGGVWCADENCPLQAENSEIGNFRDIDTVFTLAELHGAIADHIATRREYESNEGGDA